ncbi:MAP kinase-activated protein kinase 2 (Fragment) [Seminavis robusta]|uniref:non-specific serine/threonine protein kinase n=1 Tax=Seminavis robusta TaxID=568900 RepID=A0A9N8DU34_9STRA
MTTEAANPRALPLRCYSSLDPVKACTPTFSLCLSTESAHVPTRSRRQKNPRRSIMITAKDFVTHKVGHNLHDDYDVQDMVGEGGFGEVYRAIHRATGSERAVKVLPRSADQEENEQVRNEFDVVKNLDHPNILKQYNMYESDDKLYLVTDIYLGGEMFEELEENGLLTEQDAASLMNHLLSCIHYCHQKGICHRDVKPENLLMSGNKKWEDIKLIDFGLACYHNDDEDEPMTEVFGSPYYVAPQVLEGEYTNKADIWSCGTVAFVALAGYAPFDGDSTEDVIDRVHEGVFDFEDEVWDDVSEDAKDFIRKLLTYDESERPTALEALQHPWLVQEREAHKQRVFSDSERRSSMEEVLAGMQCYEAKSKLKQATFALLASQFLSKEERAEIDEIFRVLDADCSGQLTKDEVQKGFADFYKNNLSDDEIDSLFAKVNFSKTNEISYSEFVCACLMQMDVLDEKRLLAAFREFDLDGSGTISVEELKEIFGACRDNEGLVDDDMIDAIIAQVDKTEDGEIDFEGFKSFLLSPSGEPSKETLQQRHNSKASLGLDDEDDISEFACESQSELFTKDCRYSLLTASTEISTGSSLEFDDGSLDGPSLSGDEDGTFIIKLSTVEQTLQHEDEASIANVSAHSRESEYSTSKRRDELASVSVHKQRCIFEELIAKNSS